MKCKQIKLDGSACKARAIGNSGFCWFHSPRINNIERQYSRYMGGKNRHIPAVIVKLPDISIKGPLDVPPLLLDTIRHLRRGEINVRLSTALCYLSNVLLKSYEPELEARIEKMEKFLKEYVTG